MNNILPDFFPDSINSSIRTVKLKKNEYLFRNGSSVESLFYIIEGEIKATRYHIDGTESIMMRARDGEFFAESGIATQQYVCDAVASRSTRLVIIPITEVRDLLSNSADFSIFFTMNMAKMLRRQCSRYERLRLNKARDRVLHYLLCESDHENSVYINSTIGDWATDMGLEPETLYRTLKELETERKIIRDKKRIQLIMS